MSGSLGLGSLLKFGVPKSDGSAPGGLLQPKLTNRFRVRVSSFGDNISDIDLTQQVQSVAKPSIKYAEVKIDSYNSVAYVLGKHEWSTVELVVKDDVSNNVSYLITYQMQKQLNQVEQTAFATGAMYKFIMYIDTMDGGNDTVLDSWELDGCLLTDVKFAALDYTKSDLQLITMTIRFDNAIMTTPFNATPDSPVSSVLTSGHSNRVN